MDRPASKRNNLPFLRISSVNSDGHVNVMETPMSKHGHMPPVPPANHNQKGPGDLSKIPSSEPLKHADVNPAEQGQTANIKQSTNKGFFKGPSSNSAIAFHTM